MRNRNQKTSVHSLRNLFVLLFKKPSIFPFSKSRRFLASVPVPPLIRQVNLISGRIIRLDTGICLNTDLFFQRKARLRPILALDVQIVELLEVSDKHLLPVVLAVELQQVHDTGHLVVPALLLPDTPNTQKTMHR